MNTGQKNTKGRTIYRGPRGGEYVLSAGGWKITKFTKASTAAAAPAPAAAPTPAPVAGNTGQKNTKGRTIFRGPRGGEYVLNGTRKIRTFTRATAAAAAPAPPARSALNNAKAHMNTLPTAAARKAYLRSMTGNMANANWHALDRYKQHLNFTGPIAKKLAKMLKLNNNTYINKQGFVFNRFLKRANLTTSQANVMRTRAFNKDPKHLAKLKIPYVGPGRPNEAFMKKHKLKNSTLLQTGKTSNGVNTGVHKRVYFNKNGILYYLTLNGRKNSVVHATQNFRIHGGSRNLRQLKREIGWVNPSYPRAEIPPATPEVRRSSPVLLANMMNQIYNGGRGANVNARRYTNAERNVLIRRLTYSIDYFKEQRNTKKAEAARHRTNLRAPAISAAERQRLQALASAANERVGYYNDAVRAYSRGLRAVKPLTGAVTPRARAMAATPNRSTPAPANVEENIIYMPLNRPHLVVKVPGVTHPIYLNPNTFTGLVKNAARVNIAPANVRNWLRMARRNFPNEPLFRHPLAAKNVTASHIRFSRA